MKIVIQLSVNETFKSIDDSKVYRLLWIDEGNVIIYLIDVYDEKAMPFLDTIRNIHEGFANGQYIKLSTNELFPIVNHEGLKEKDKLIRDKAWGIIQDLVSKEPNIFKKNERGKLILEATEKFGCTYKTIYKYLKRYWQRGKVKDSLLPDYKNCGNKGEQKNWNGNKTGRPRITNSIGVNITSEIKEKFKRAVQSYYFSNQENTLAYTYKMMIRDNFQSSVYYQNNTKYINILDEDNIPTLGQFYYWFNKEYGIQEVTIAKYGRKKFERDYRPVLGSSSFEVFGPGSRYQIDATIANVYLVSRYNADWVLKRPTIYYVTDVYTHLITGFYVGLEGPSWIGMMMALLNSTVNKKDFCANYNISITDDCWPAAHLPEIILGDRGELEGYNVNHLIEGLNITIENNPSFRPDWKGIVEKLFDTSQEKIRPFLPGYVSKDWGKRGTKDPRLGAKLDIEQYTKIIINFILHYNKNFYMKNYIRDKDMVVDNVKPTPIELWKWGVKNRAGKLRVVHPDIMKFYLMPRGSATVTAKGIRFEKMLYSCDTALQQSWFSTARTKKSWKVDFSYDPRNMNHIYIHTGNEEIFEKCYLLKHQERYQNKTLEEVKQLNALENKDYKDSEHSLLQSEINFFDNIQSIVKEAIKETSEKQTKNVTKVKKIKGISHHTKWERNVRRTDEVFKIDKNEEKTLTEGNHLDNQQENEFKHRSVKELFNKRRGRKNE
ncbi:MULTISPECIES: Mu transposase C-terminal domain-containing protein [Bacillus cereus group]|uniref:Mu transposase C-terminal domain-containing protein n=2 Tax=Bacillus TaxID=1386 RepID=UPI001F5A8490|nr:MULTISPECIES: Mu transposase C-terminal domain-containing protein [Bacillus cereus group]MEB9455289.1 Mu transposase C-terminal domain-containing protein [Bacillus anthracis]